MIIMFPLIESRAGVFRVETSSCRFNREKQWLYTVGIWKLTRNVQKKKTFNRPNGVRRSSAWYFIRCAGGGALKVCRRGVVSSERFSLFFPLPQSTTRVDKHANYLKNKNISKWTRVSVRFGNDGNNQALGRRRGVDFREQVYTVAGNRSIRFQTYVRYPRTGYCRFIRDESNLLFESFWCVYTYYCYFIRDLGQWVR